MGIFHSSSVMPFPHSVLPVPALPPIPRKVINDIRQQLGISSRYELLEQVKRFKKTFHWLGLDLWRKIRTSLSMKNLFLYSFQNTVKETPILERKESALHNIINRNTGKTLEEGGLFTTMSSWYGCKTSHGEQIGQAQILKEGILDVYAKVRSDFVNELDSLMRLLEQVGFGMDASVGKGQFEIGREEQDFSFLEECPGHSHWLNLSTFSSTDCKDLKGLLPDQNQIWKSVEWFWRNQTL